MWGIVQIVQNCIKNRTPPLKIEDSHFGGCQLGFVPNVSFLLDRSDMLAGIQ